MEIDMTKAKTPAPDAETTEGQDTVAASTEWQDQAGAAEGGPMHEPAALNVDALTHCARQIDMLNTSGHRLGLIDELVQLYRMEITEDDEAGTVTIACEGVSIEPADTVENALTNWANAARRACMAAA
jgi:hypothetical protein